MQMQIILTDGQVNPFPWDITACFGDELPKGFFYFTGGNIFTVPTEISPVLVLAEMKSSDVDGFIISSPPLLPLQVHEQSRTRFSLLCMPQATDQKHNVQDFHQRREFEVSPLTP